MEGNLRQVQDRVAAALARAGRPPNSVTLVGVSKAQSAAKIRELARLGLRDFGENYVQEWLGKRRELENADPTLASRLRWHFIGHLQSNKAREALSADLIHSVDSLKLARKLSEAALKAGKVQALLWELNLAGEATKSGMSADVLRRELPAYAALPGLRWRGLMTMPPPAEDPEASRPYFRRLKSLLDEIRASGFFDPGLVELSMGMSQDYEVAVEEGATLIRVGSRLFGPRI
ncbi:MAG TPA: YggS family pyridoxal phosphate-dependent enzyme [bacterium]|nr:YggS family pyridoxal phosphate-dependent enzyme [bacterium]